MPGGRCTKQTDDKQNCRAERTFNQTVPFDLPRCAPRGFALLVSQTRRQDQPIDACDRHHAKKKGKLHAKTRPVGRADQSGHFTDKHPAVHKARGQQRADVDDAEN